MFQSKKNVGCDTILTNEVLSYPKYQNIKTTLSNEPKYQHLLLLEASMNQNQKCVMELKLKNKIRSAYQH
jgi:hypothetical protein